MQGLMGSRVIWEGAGGRGTMAPMVLLGIRAPPETVARVWCVVYTSFVSTEREHARARVREREREMRDNTHIRSQAHILKSTHYCDFM
jgi:hypothetical protein